MNMNFSHLRKAALAATVAACAIALPAQARDGEAYVGVDLGLVIPQDTKIDVNGLNNNAVIVNNKKGWEGDVVLGYDWGMIRTEAELAHKEWKPNSLDVILPGVADPAGAGVVTGLYSDPGGTTHLTTAMVNALLDFGGNGGVGFSVGVGAGRAWETAHLSATSGGTDFLHDSDSTWAWQGVAQLRVPVSDNVELGLKYKYLDTFHHFVMTDVLGRRNEFGARAHSIMASLLVNFGGHAAPPPPPPPAPSPPPPPPPPPPAPPQTKTCADGSTVGLYDNCPVPPPAVVAPRGERG